MTNRLNFIYQGTPINFADPFNIKIQQTIAWWRNNQELALQFCKDNTPSVYNRAEIHNKIWSSNVDDPVILKSAFVVMLNGPTRANKKTYDFLGSRTINEFWGDVIGREGNIAQRLASGLSELTFVMSWRLEEGKMTDGMPDFLRKVQYASIVYQTKWYQQHRQWVRQFTTQIGGKINENLMDLAYRDESCSYTQTRWKNLLRSYEDSWSGPISDERVNKLLEYMMMSSTEMPVDPPSSPKK